MASAKIGNNRSREKVSTKSNEALLNLMSTARPRDRNKIRKVLQARGVDYNPQEGE